MVLFAIYAGIVQFGLLTEPIQVQYCFCSLYCSICSYNRCLLL